MSIFDGGGGFIATSQGRKRQEARAYSDPLLDLIEETIREKIQEDKEATSRRSRITKILASFKRIRGKTLSAELATSRKPANDDEIAKAVIIELLSTEPNIVHLVGPKTVESVRDKPKGSLSENYWAREHLIDFCIYGNKASIGLPLASGGGVSTDNA